MDIQRRTLVGVALTGGAVSACGPKPDRAATSPAEPVPSNRQRGVSDPLPRQRYAAILVLAVAEGADVRTLLADLTTTIAGLDDADGLTVTVGVGPGVVRTARDAGFVGGQDLPTFASDAIEDDAEGGDLLLQVCADRKPTVAASVATLTEALTPDATVSWAIDGYRGEVEGVAGRNVLGFFDGLAVPTTDKELDDDVWTTADDGLADATICVVRRIRLDHRRFERLPVAEQEATIGRTKRTGAPLSGGTIDDDVNLQAKSGSGVYDIANDAHVRRAHPLFSGAGGLMLRRSYSYRNGPDDQGLAFICFQRELQMFVRTQSSMDGGDRLLDFATTTGSATFLVLPAATDGAPLGATLFDA